jgi:hypothetical protein
VPMDMRTDRLHESASAGRPVQRPGR